MLQSMSLAFHQKNRIIVKQKQKEHFLLLLLLHVQHARRSCITVRSTVKRHPGASGRPAIDPASVAAPRSGTGGAAVV